MTWYLRDLRLSFQNHQTSVFKYIKCTISYIFRSGSDGKMIWFWTILCRKLRKTDFCKIFASGAFYNVFCCIYMSCSLIKKSYIFRQPIKKHFIKHYCNSPLVSNELRDSQSRSKLDKFLNLNQDLFLIPDDRLSELNKHSKTKCWSKVRRNPSETQVFI